MIESRFQQRPSSFCLILWGRLREQYETIHLGTLATHGFQAKSYAEPQVIDFQLPGDH